MDLFEDMFRLAVGEGCSYVVMLSGQDYPLRHLGGLEAELPAYDVWADANPLFAATVRATGPRAGAATRTAGGTSTARPSWPEALTGWPKAVLRVPTVGGAAAALPGALSHETRSGGVLKAAGRACRSTTGSMWMSLSARAVEVLFFVP